MPYPCPLVHLKKRSEFLAVASVRQRWVTPNFIVQKAPRSADPKETIPVCGYGLTASKKMVGCAVKRNRSRRRLRALVREVLSSLAVEGLNFVFIAKEGTLTADYAQLRRDLKWAMKRLNITS